MSFFSKTLPALALAVALFPLAAYAQTAPQQSELNNGQTVWQNGPAYQTYAQTAPRQSQLNNGQTVVQSGPVNQMYPASVGG
jgi:hypothetical protein